MTCCWAGYDIILFLPFSLCCFQGLFFDEAYGFYPGQVLIGPAKVFSNVQWLSGVKPVLSRKCKFRVVVEEVRHGGGPFHSFCSLFWGIWLFCVITSYPVVQVFSL